MNETIQTILTRRSMRSYFDTPVPREYLELIVRCGQFAATANGLQPWHFTVVTNRALLDRVTRDCREVMLKGGEGSRRFASDPDFDVFRGAPCAIIASCDANNHYGDIDCANAVENMALAAKSLNLGSCYIALFRQAFESGDAAGLREALGIPEGYRPTLSLAVGYARGEASERAPRRENTVNWIE